MKILTHFRLGLALAVLFVAGCSSCEDTTTLGPGELEDTGLVSDASVSDDMADMTEMTGTTDMSQDTATDSGADAEVDMGMACPSSRQCGQGCCTVDEACVLEQCLPPCASGVRCGADLATCCSMGDVCISNACTTPGATCLDSFDCAQGDYCEPTIGQCLPTPAVACEVRPQPAPIALDIEWHWQGVSSEPTYKRLLVTPAVADIDLDMIPDVVFSAYDDGCSGDGILTAIDGATGVEKWAVTDPQYRVECSAHPAIGNLDSDPELEVVAIAEGTGGILAFDHDGSFLWRYDMGSADDRHDLSALSLADVNSDGTTEVILGGLVVNHDGTTLVDHGMLGLNWTDGSSPISTVADLDGDGVMELIGGGRVLRLDGTVVWEDFSGSRDGYPAVADFFGDGQPDIVSIRTGEARIYEALTGTLLFGPIAIPGGGRGGPPTVADFDGDGNPEFSTAGNGKYAVYDPDCQGAPDAAFCPSQRTDGILWDIDVQDLSSNATGSSVFDFEEDGRAEVIYNDECSLYVLDGVTGNILLQRANSSRTGTENPIVVDVDGDNNSEIVVPANDDQLGRDGCATGTFGLFAFGDPNDNWVRTRRVWNQHSYHVTNIQGDGGIPMLEPTNWLDPDLNNFRQNVQGEGVFNAPDLQVDFVRLGDATCSGTLEANVSVRISNQGALGVGAGVTVRVYAVKNGETMPVEIGVIQTTKILLPGAFEDLLAQWTIPQDFVDAGFEIFAEIDPDNSVGECIEDNNDLSNDYQDVTFTAPDVVITEITTDELTCRNSMRLPITVTVENMGSAPVPAGLPISVQLISPGTQDIGVATVSNGLNPGDSATVSLDWSVPGSLLGSDLTLEATVDPDQSFLTCDQQITETLQTKCPVIQ